MRLWLAAGLFTLATAPLAEASETAIACGLEPPNLWAEVTTLAVEPPAPAAPRKAERAARAEAAAAPPAAPAPAVRVQATQNDQRRRGGSLRRIPDAMLIDGRGVL